MTHQNGNTISVESSSSDTSERPPRMVEERIVVQTSDSVRMHFVKKMPELPRSVEQRDGTFATIWADDADDDDDDAPRPPRPELQARIDAHQRWLDQGGRDELATFAQDVPEPIVDGTDVVFLAIENGTIIRGWGDSPRAAFVAGAAWFLETFADPVRQADADDAPPPAVPLVEFWLNPETGDLRDLRVVEVRGDVALILGFARALKGTF